MSSKVASQLRFFSNPLSFLCFFLVILHLLKGPPPDANNDLNIFFSIDLPLSHSPSSSPACRTYHL